MTYPAIPDKPVDGRTARRGDTRAAILDAATRLFAARGVEATSVDEIAAHSRTAKGSIYYNFTSKGGLVSALIERSVDDVARAVSAATEGLRGAPARQAIIATILLVMENYPDVTRVMISELLRTESEWRTQLERWRSVLITAMSEQYRDDCSDDRNCCDLRASAAVGATLLAGMEWLGFHPEMEYAEVLDHILDIVGD